MRLRRIGVATRVLDAVSSTPEDLDALVADSVRRCGPIVEVVGTQAEITFVTTHPRAAVSIWLPALGRAFPTRMRALGTTSDGETVWAYGMLAPAGSSFGYVFIADNPVSTIGPITAAKLFTSASARSDLTTKVVGSSFVDPRNPHRAPGPYGNESVTVPATDESVAQWVSVVHTELAPPPTTPLLRGRLITLELDRQGTTRHVSVYVPPNSSPNTSSTPNNSSGPNTQLPVAIVLDGETFSWFAADVDRAIDSGQLPPTVVAFVHNPVDRDRIDELTDGDELETLLVDTLLPRLRADFPVTAEASGITIVGSSIGAVGASLVALSRPEAIGSVLALSGSFWWGSRAVGGHELIRRSLAARTEPWPVALWLSHGNLEADVGRGKITFLGCLRSFAADAHTRVDAVTVREYPGGHDLAGWRRPFLDGLRELQALQ